VSAVAKAVGVNRRTVAEWRDKGCPLTTLNAVIQWRNENLRSDRQPIEQRDGGASSMTRLHEAQVQANIRKIKGDTRLRHQRLLKETNKLVERVSVVREVAELVVRVKERILALPEELENRFAPEVRLQLKEDVDEFARQLLFEMATYEILGDPTDDLILASADLIRAKRERAAAKSTQPPPAEAGSETASNS